MVNCYKDNYLLTNDMQIIFSDVIDTLIIA